MQQDEQKDMFNVRTPYPAENVYKQYQLIVAKPRSFTHSALYSLIFLYESFSAHSGNAALIINMQNQFYQQMQFSAQKEPFSV